ncbi:MAG: HAMP domain-containing sensor histidine kinase [Pseudomonadota bacterium]
MRIVPRSLSGRLLAIAAVTTLAALVFAAFAIGHVLERFVTDGLDRRLDAQIAVLAGAIDAQGRFVPARATILPDFAEPAAGWRWQVTDAAGRVTASGAALPIPPRLPEPGRGPHRWPRGADGGRSHLRSVVLPTPSGEVTIVAAGPRALIERPIRDAMTPLLVSLGLLGLALGTATLVQLRLGLRPLRTLRLAVEDVGAGRRAHVPEDQPVEIRPLATALNALIDRNAAGLAHARRHVANLAHGLKTPIAAIGVKLGEPGRDPDGALAAMLRDVDARIRHHLGRARAAAPGGTGGRVLLAPAIGDLVAVLARIHGARAVTIAVPADLAAAIDPQDLDELAGNLLDNAWRHAATTICVAAHGEGGMLVLAIEDDGPGLTDAQLIEARMPGRRLDERGDGHGFGLPIAEEIAELNGGGMALDRSGDLGGLRVRVTLPRATLAPA